MGGHREGEPPDSRGAESHTEILHRNNEGNKVMTVADRTGAPYGEQDWPDPWESDEDEEEEIDWPHISFPSKSYLSTCPVVIPEIAISSTFLQSDVGAPLPLQY